MNQTIFFRIWFFFDAGEKVQVHLCIVFFENLKTFTLKSRTLEFYDLYLFLYDVIQIWKWYSKLNKNWKKKSYSWEIFQYINIFNFSDAMCSLFATSFWHKMRFLGLGYDFLFKSLLGHCGEILNMFNFSDTLCSAACSLFATSFRHKMRFLGSMARIF